MRPATKDLARTASVSLATVDRVLNGRRGVAGDTIERARRAIGEIGFVRNASAATLARGRAHRFVFVLPGTDDLFVQAIAARIAETNLALAPEMVQLEEMTLRSGDPHDIARRIGGISARDADGVALMVPQSPQTRDAILRLRERVPGLVSFVTGQEDLEAVPRVGIDDRAAGAAAARLVGKFLGGRRGSVLVIGETMTLRNEIERRLGFDEVLQGAFPGLRARPSLETHRDADRARRIIATAMSNTPDVVAVYAPSAEARLCLQALPGRDGRDPFVVAAHERTPFTEQELKAGRVDALIAQDPGHLVRSAVRRLRGRASRAAHGASPRSGVPRRCACRSKGSASRPWPGP